MNDMTAPSVSLEGKTLWILRSMPVTTRQILRAKLAMQLLLSGISVLFAAICICIAFAVPIGSTIAVILACLSLVVLLAEFGLFLDLKKPNLNWTTEITPIKQSSSVMFALFGGWLYVLLFGAGWFLGAHALGAELYLMLFFALNMILSAVLRSWLMRSGTDIFESL
jgi:ABC-2 type transport system permease protein